MKSQFPLAAQALQNWIATQKLLPGARLPSAQKMAKEIGFTAAIIMRACQSLVSSGLLLRNGYKLTVAHERKSTSSLQGLVYIVAYPVDDAFVHTVQRILTERGVQYRTITIPSLAFATIPHVLAKLLNEEKPAGIILRSLLATDSLRQWLKEISIPMVVFAEGLHPTTQSSVQIDSPEAIEKCVNHLHEIGHRRIALFFAGYDITRTEWIEAYRVACLKRNLKESSTTIWNSENHRDDIVRDTLIEGRRIQPEVTAVILWNRFAPVAIQTFSVPREMSVVGIGESSFSVNSRPPVTVVALRDPDVLASWACTDLMDQIQAIRSGRPPKFPTEARFVPELLLRKSTRAIQTKKAPVKVQVTAPSPIVHPSQTWRKVYPFLQRNGWDEWRPLDLSKLANHSITRHHGWLGTEPLEHFPPGLRSIHGVPFQVLNEERNRGCAVVTFLSPHSHSAKGKRLPSEATLEVNLRTKALYFLHGCGYAKPILFAEYIMHFASGQTSSVPLVPLGLTRTHAPKLPKHLRPNLQDWWEGYEQRHFPHAHHAIIYDVTNPTAYARTLYSLEWINPFPEDPVKSIEVRVDPKAGPVLALVSVTALL